MAFDVKEKVEEIVSKINESGDMMKEFKEDPAKAVKKLAGVDLPDNLLDQLVTGVKAKVGADSLLSGAKKLGGLFGK